MVVALWWSWVATTWVTNWLDPVRLPVRGAVIALAFVALVVSISIADAFGERAWVFAIAYVVLQLGRTGFIVLATWRQDRAAALDFTRVLVWTAAGSVLWIVGALLPLPAQLPFWALALGLEVLGTLSGFPLPMMGPMDMGRWDISGAHIAERSALFVLIALGEGLLVTGFAFVDLDIRSRRGDRQVARPARPPPVLVDLLRPRRAHRGRGDGGLGLPGAARPDRVHLVTCRHRRHRADERRRQGAARDTPRTRASRR